VTNNTDPNIALMPLLATVKDAVGAELHARLVALGFPEIRPAHGCVFGNIDQPGARLTELADRSGLTKQSVGEAVADLEQLGFVERVPDPEDGRAKIIRLTSHGADALAAAEEIFSGIEARFAAEVGRERFDEFRETLTRLAELSRATAAPVSRAA
jgi:DNA-binding MarR family transcriptional regulator